MIGFRGLVLAAFMAGSVIAICAGPALSSERDASSVAEDDETGWCNSVNATVGEAPIPIRMCEKLDLEAGACPLYHGSVDQADACAVGNEGGMFIQALQKPGAGKLDPLLDLYGVYADIYVSMEKDEALRWLRDNRNSVMDIALAKWARVYRRNHRFYARTCVRIVDSSIFQSDAESWA